MWYGGLVNSTRVSKDQEMQKSAPALQCARKCFFVLFLFHTRSLSRCHLKNGIGIWLRPVCAMATLIWMVYGIPVEEAYHRRPSQFLHHVSVVNISAAKCKWKCKPLVHDAGIDKGGSFGLFYLILRWNRKHLVFGGTQVESFEGVVTFLLDFNTSAKSVKLQEDFWDLKHIFTAHFLWE